MAHSTRGDRGRRLRRRCPRGGGSHPNSRSYAWPSSSRVGRWHRERGVALPLSTWLAEYPTWREHALAAIAALGDLPALREAEEWALANVPPDEPSVLLHGDLLGQNILLHASEPTAVIDWEAAMRGDPAYDLAIVTRGVRRPFCTGSPGTSTHRLLDAYAACGPRRITAPAVHLYELCLAGRWYRQALEGANPQEPADQALRRVEQILGRARAAAARDKPGIIDL